MNRAHLIELDTTFAQRRFLVRACGVSRYTWNWALAQCEESYKLTGKTQNISDLKKRWNQEKPEWVYDSPKDANQQPFSDLRMAYIRFFKGLGKCPVFKKKGESRGSFYLSNTVVKVTDTHVKIPLLGEIRLKEAPRFKGKLMSATVSLRADRWFISLSYELVSVKDQRPDNVIGVDLGVKTLATLSDGTKIENPRHLDRAIRRLKLAHRRVSRRNKGSRNRNRARKILAKIHLKVSNKRKDTIHKTTRLIVQKATIVVIEDLNVSGMTKNHSLARAISDCGFYEFRRQLEYKAKKVIVADRFYPSSKLCSVCQTKNTNLKLSDREWRCVCGVLHDRDLNAALNLKSLSGATREITPVEIGVPCCKTRSRSLKQEPKRGVFLHN